MQLAHTAVLDIAKAGRWQLTRDDALFPGIQDRADKGLEIIFKFFLRDVSRMLNLFASWRTCIGMRGAGRGGQVPTDLPLLANDQDFDGVEQTGNLSFAPICSQLSSGCAGGVVQGNPGTRARSPAAGRAVAVRHGTIESSSAPVVMAAPVLIRPRVISEMLLNFVCLAKSGDCFF